MKETDMKITPEDTHIKDTVHAYINAHVFKIEQWKPPLDQSAVAKFLRFWAIELTLVPCKGICLRNCSRPLIQSSHHTKKRKVKFSSRNGTNLGKWALYN